MAKGSRSEAVGAVLLALLLAWVALSASQRGGDPAPALLLGAAAGGVYVVARVFGAWQWWMPPALVVLAGALLWAWPAGGTIASGKPFGPMGYANATGALYVQVFAGGLMLAMPSGSGWRRSAGFLAALGAAAATVASGSAASIVVLPVVLLLSLLRPRAGSIVGAVVVAAVLGTTVLLGASWEGEGESAAVQALTERRLDLWSEAVALTAQNPVFGLGPGRFEDVAPTPREDQDAVAVHNEYLETSVETGIPALALLLLILGWAFWRLGVEGSGRHASVAAAALTGIAAQSAMDYIVHAPAVLVLAVILVAAGHTDISAMALDRVSSRSLSSLRRAVDR